MERLLNIFHNRPFSIEALAHDSPITEKEGARNGHPPSENKL